jgi:hypothetical protein
MWQEAVKARQVRDHWGIRLTFIQELTELHALVAHFCVQARRPLPSPSSARLHTNKA